MRVREIGVQMRPCVATRVVYLVAGQPAGVSSAHGKILPPSRTQRVSRGFQLLGDWSREGSCKDLVQNPLERAFRTRRSWAQAVSSQVVMAFLVGGCQ